MDWQKSQSILHYLILALLISYCVPNVGNLIPSTLSLLVKNIFFFWNKGAIGTSFAIISSAFLNASNILFLIYHHL